MIKINLLPKELKKEQKPKKEFSILELPKISPKLFKAGIYGLSALLGINFLIAASVIAKSASLGSLNNKWQALQPNKAQIDRLNLEISSIEKKTVPVKKLMEKRILWAKELNELSNLMPPGVWLTKFFIQKQAGEKGGYKYILNIEGCAASLYGDEATLIANFVKAIQGNQEFFKYFNEAKLGPMEKAMMDKTPIMNFKIFCLLKRD